MAILEDVEVSIVATETGQALEEFDNPKDDPTTNPRFTEKYIQATTGVRFQVQIYVRPSFNLYKAHGIDVTVDIDGGVVHHTTFYDKKWLEENRADKQPFIDDHVLHKMGSRWVESPYLFGSIDIDEELDVAKATVDQQATVLGSIRVTVERVHIKRLRVPRLKTGSMYNPQALIASKELVKKGHVSHMMQTGELKPSEKLRNEFETHEYNPYSGKNCHELEFVFRYRSEMHLDLLGCIQDDQPTASSQATASLNTETEAFTSRIQALEKETLRLKAELAEVKNQPRNGISVIKQEKEKGKVKSLIKDEEGEVEEVDRPLDSVSRSMSGRRPAKRAKVFVDLTED